LSYSWTLAARSDMQRGRISMWEKAWITECRQLMLCCEQAGTLMLCNILWDAGRRKLGSPSVQATSPPPMRTCALLTPRPWRSSADTYGARKQYLSTCSSAPRSAVRHVVL